MSKPLRVLIVEDSEDDAELLVYQLERNGYDVISQRVDTQIAMSLALKQGVWDVILADYSLPNFSATAALKLLQETGLDLPFIIVSGNIGDGIAVAAMKAGAHDYLLKHNLARLVPAVERELQEAANRALLKESEDRWQLALLGSNDGIWDWNIKTNTVFFSQRWKTMLGYEDQEIANNFDEWSKRVHPDDLGWVQQAINDHLVQKTHSYNIEHRLQCQDGSYKWILSRGRGLWDQQGNPVRVVGSHTDISDRKQMEVTLRQQAEYLADANRLKDEFLGIISHELRTPLNAIVGWLDLLRTRRLDSKMVDTALETIDRNTKALHQLIEDILEVSRTIQGKLRLTVTAVNLVEIIEASLAAVQVAADAKKIQIQTNLDGDGLIMGDASRLQQVIYNLLSNAVKFTPSGGSVQVQLAHVADNIEIKVSDTGIGIKPEFTPYVFDRFRQADSTSTRYYGGLGIGLAIVRQLVELHGGTVSVESEGENRGATFIIKFPLTTTTDQNGRIKEDENSPSQTLVATNSQTLEGLQILVVDDDQDNRDLLMFALSQYGAQVRDAGSAEEALMTLTQYSPDILVSDIGMPDLDGYALIRQIKDWEVQQGRKLPAVALTGYAKESDRAKALAAGFDYHLCKPVEIDELVAVVSRLALRC